MAGMANTIAGIRDSDCPGKLDSEGSTMEPIQGKPVRKRRRWLIVGTLVYLALVICGWAGVYVWWHSPSWQFERSVVAEMSKSEVRKAVGSPAQVLNSGEALEKWGSVMKHEVNVETWVYFVWPASQNRFVLEFDGDRVKTVVRQPN
jgi:hypothetical protein